MLFCSVCGSQATPDVRRCPCGAELAPAAPVWSCSRCGAPAVDGASTCFSCGVTLLAPAGQNASPPPGGDDASKIQRKAWSALRRGFLAAVLFALFVRIFWTGFIQHFALDKWWGGAGSCRQVCA